MNDHQAVTDAAREFVAAAEAGEGKDRSGIVRLALALDSYSMAITRLGSRPIPHEDPTRFDYQLIRSRLAPLWPSFGMYPCAADTMEQWIEGHREATLGDAMDDIVDIFNDLSEALALESHSTDVASAYARHMFEIHTGWHVNVLRLHLHNQFLCSGAPERVWDS